MKLSKRQLRRIIREAIESAGQNKLSKMDTSGIYPRPQHPMIANAGKETDSARLDTIADTLCDITGLTPDVCDKAAQSILAALKRDGLI